MTLAAPHPQYRSTRDQHRRLSPGERAAVGVRYLLLVGVAVGTVGLVGRWLAWPVLASAIGPTAYVFIAHPKSETSRFRNAVVGHAVAIGAGLGALAIFGLWTHPSMSATGSPTWVQIGAAIVAAGATVAILELLGSHHAPAAATTLLVATGLAKPGRPLAGLVVGLAVVLTIGPLLSRFPLARRAAVDEQGNDAAARGAL